jgi:diguanylate cyclase (GGDEF)-like protein/PAS domain S-box-containing protein
VVAGAIHEDPDWRDAEGASPRNGFPRAVPQHPADSTHLRLLEAVAAAAHDAPTLEALAPRVLTLVCDAFGWSGGALLSCGEGDTTPTVAVTVGAPVLDVSTCDLDGPPGEVRHVRGAVVVPLAPARLRHQALVLTPSGPVLDDQRSLLALVGSEVCRAVEREVAADRLHHNLQRFRSVFDLSPLPMALTTGFTGTYAVVNESFCRMLGRTREELLGASARDVVHPRDLHLVEPAGTAALNAADGRHREELRLLHADGSVVTAMVTLAWVAGPDGERNLLTQIEDITARRTVEELLRRQAEQDALTGVANRSHLSQFLTRLTDPAVQCVTLFIDLDGFKLINDSRGHGVGDEVLVEVARRLSGVIGRHDLVARFGGDEFVVVSPLPVAASQEGLDARARRLAAQVERVLAAPVRTDGGSAVVTASIGIAVGLVDPEHPEALVQQADTAMYHAKMLGKHRSEVYDERLHERTVAHQQTDALLRHALAEDRFVVHYQPIVDLADGYVVGVEALVRLRDLEGELVPPGRFIAAAESSGLIVPMGAYVLREGCRTVADIRRRTGRELGVSVNVAAQQAARPDLGATVIATLAEAGLPECALTLELTESALLEADGSTLRQLVGLRERGVRVGLDDFGTGYSSLTYLRTFPVSHLKVDRSFVQGMVTSSSDRAIVRAVTGLADDLGLQWVAEGIEEPAQHEAVAALGHGLAQGFLFGRPMPEDELLAFLDR